MAITDNHRETLFAIDDITGQEFAITGDSATGSLNITLVDASAATENAATATLANVATSTSNATLLASNSSRKKAIIVNDSLVVLYIKFGTAATSSSYSYLLQPYDTLEEYNYTGRIDGILASSTGNARVSEL